MLVGPALLSAGLTVWQWLAGRRFPLHQRTANRGFTPGLTLLKPLKGADAHTAACLRSWLAQDYPGDLQVLFGVADPADPVCELVKRLLAEFPGRNARLVLCPERRGVNAKVAKLVQLQPLAAHDLLVVSDADVLAPPDLLTQLVIPFGAQPDGSARSAHPPTGGAPSTCGPTSPVGLVNCLYRLAGAASAAHRCEAVAVNADFWSQVLQARMLKPQDFALGAVMAVRREALEQIGGFAAFADHLADDYELGHRVARAGWRVELCPVVVDCYDPPRSWGQVWAHQLRWARTIRVCQPGPYFLSLLANGTLWPLLWLATGVAAGNTRAALGGGLTPPVLLAVALLAMRLLVALDLQRRLTGSSARWREGWLVPVKDLLQVGVWAGAFAGRRIEWRGERYRLRRDGRLQRA